MRFLMFLSQAITPLLVFYILGFAVLSRRPVMDDFLDGAKEGMRTVARLLPTLVGLMTAVAVWRSSGFLDFLCGLLAEPARFLHIPAQIMPVALVRLVSNSAAVSLVLDLFQKYGPDSPLGLTASILMSSTETVLYCISVYFGSAGITRIRYTLAGGLLATAVGMGASIVLAGWMGG